jgi:ParB/RepB/Spo0J family partition protein
MAMAITELPLDAVVINGRIRQDLGNLDELAASIANRGLLHPLILRPGNHLVAGLRRLEACKRLSWPTIPVRILTGLADTLQALEAEREENACRLDYTPSEAVAAAAPIEKVLVEEARKRQATSTGGARPRLKTASGKLPEAVKGQARDKVAAAVGMSGRTYEKAKEVVAAAEAGPDAYGDLRERMDRTRNVDHAYKKLRIRRRERQRRELAAGVAVDGDIRVGDFRTALADLPDGSVDLILTDPLYHKDSIPLYGDLARLAARVLADGGSLVCYAGQYALPDIFPLMTPHLRYQWCLVARHSGAHTRQHGWRVRVGWKPLLWFVKGRYGGEYFDDVIDSEPGNKDHHDWAQGSPEALYLIGHLCPQGCIVLDPMCGSGTTLRAARRLGRRYLGVEIDEERARVASALLADG